MGRVYNVKICSWIVCYSWACLQTNCSAFPALILAWEELRGCSLRMSSPCRFWKLLSGREKYKSQAWNKEAKARHTWGGGISKKIEHIYRSSEHPPEFTRDVDIIFFHFFRWYLAKLTLSHCDPEGNIFLANWNNWFNYSYGWRCEKQKPTEFNSSNWV